MKKSFLFFLLFSLVSFRLFSADLIERQISHQTSFGDNNKLEIIVISQEDSDKAKKFITDIAEKAVAINNVIKSDFEKLGTKTTEINLITLEFIQEAVNLSKVTDGWFDITSPSSKSWFIKKDYRRIETTDTPPTAKLKSSGIKFDIDTLLSAFIVEQASKALIENGYLNGLVSIGNIQKGFGEDLYTPWTISVPKEEIKDSKAYMANHYGIRNAGWVIFTNNLQIIDSKSKKPVLPWFINMTVLSTKATTAVAFAYTIASLGPKIGVDYIQTHNEIEAVITTPKGEVFASKAFKLASPYVFKELKGNHGPNTLSQKQREEEAESNK